MRSRALRLALLALIVLGMLPASGCKQVQKTIVSLWPKAESERTVQRPNDEIFWPLTGLKATKADAVSRRVVSVKIENSPEARPQTNLQHADVVYETITEGGITRFNALFHSNRPETVGPVRSARLSDTYIVPQYNALFFFAGASTYVNGQLRKRAKIENLSEDIGVSFPYFRSHDKPAPHNLYLMMDRVDATAKKRGYPLTQTVRGFAFDRSGEATGPKVAEIYIPYSPAANARWVYDSATKRYSRWENGTPHVDKGTGKQLTARNVVVMWAQMKATGHRDVAGSETFDVVLDGKNRVSIFRDGMRFDGTWNTDNTTPPTFRAEDGTILRLSPGNTWFQVIPSSVNIRMK